MWSIQAFRGLSVGTDLVNYIPFFISSDSLVYDSESVEIGYFYFNVWINKYISVDPSVFLAIVSAVFLIPVGVIFKKYSKIPALSFIILASFVIYIFSFSALRQTIAIGITTLSYIYVEKKKVVPFVAMVLFATLFHASAIIFVLVYRNSKKIKVAKKIKKENKLKFIDQLTSLKNRNYLNEYLASWNNNTIYHISVLFDRIVCGEGFI